MNVSIKFPADIETTLLHRATAAGKDVATLVQELVAERLAWIPTVTQRLKKFCVRPRFSRFFSI
ncbi:MAG: hypothetical protein JSS02_35300 [Planctomycetes bacterium]|nr:hypothetical protein [Planctomycetota bacterium]